MKLVFFRGFITLVIFFFVWVACKPVFRTSGNHEWFRAYRELGRLKDGVVWYKEDHEELPNEQLVNGIIMHYWNNRDASSIKTTNSKEEDLSIYLDWVRYEQLRIWDAPPKYVVTKELPEGVGFYLEGEDGTSLSKGNDRDDINSWNYGSTSFYHKKLQREHDLRDLIVSGLFAGIAFILCYLATKRKHA